MPWAEIAGAVGGTALGMAGSGGSSALSYYFDRKLQQRAFNQQDYLAKNQHQFEVADLRAAGLNPILSAHNGSGSGGGGGSPSVQTPDMGSSALAGFRAKAERDQLEAQTKKLEQEAEMANSITGKSRAEEIAVIQAMEQSLLDGVANRDLSSAQAQYYRSQAHLSDIEAMTKPYHDWLRTVGTGVAGLYGAHQLLRGKLGFAHKFGDARISSPPPDKGGMSGGRSKSVSRSTVGNPRSPSPPRQPAPSGHSARSNSHGSAPRMTRGVGGPAPAVRLDNGINTARGGLYGSSFSGPAGVKLRP